MIEIIKVITVLLAIGVFIKAINMQYKINKEIQDNNKSGQEINTSDVIKKYKHVYILGAPSFAVIALYVINEYYNYL